MRKLQKSHMPNLKGEIEVQAPHSIALATLAFYLLPTTRIATWNPKKSRRNGCYDDTFHHLPPHHHPFFTSYKDIKRDVRHHVQCNGYYDDSYPGTARQSLYEPRTRGRDINNNPVVVNHNGDPSKEFKSRRTHLNLGS